MVKKIETSESEVPVNEIPMVEYLIKTTNGEFKIQIPDSYKVTYGPVSPGSKGYGGELALRIWESDTKQRAIFTGVQWFRDTSIPIQKKITSKSGQVVWLTTENEASETHTSKKGIPGLKNSAQNY